MIKHRAVYEKSGPPNNQIFRPPPPLLMSFLFFLFFPFFSFSSSFPFPLYLLFFPDFLHFSFFFHRNNRPTLVFPRPPPGPLQPWALLLSGGFVGLFTALIEQIFHIELTWFDFSGTYRHNPGVVIITIHLHVRPK